MKGKMKPGFAKPGNVAAKAMADQPKMVKKPTAMKKK